MTIGSMLPLQRPITAMPPSLVWTMTRLTKRESSRATALALRLSLLALVRRRGTRDPCGLLAMTIEQGALLAVRVIAGDEPVIAGGIEPPASVSAAIIGGVRWFLEELPSRCVLGENRGAPSTMTSGQLGLATEYGQYEVTGGDTAQAAIPRGSKLDPSEHLDRRLGDGLENCVVLLRELRELGYTAATRSCRNT